MKYAAGTTVPIERSRAEIERILIKYGASHFGSMVAPDRATLYFQVKGREIQIPVPMPSATDRAYTHSKHGWAFTAAQRDRLLDAERRRRWRVLLISVKALLEAVESQVMTFDEAFLSHVVVPGRGITLGALLVPRLDQLYAGLSLPALLADSEGP